jgi:hypothetical protein
MANDVLSVWNEVRITTEGISVTLFSESEDGGAVVEDETWFTFDELQERAPSEPLSLNLSDETSERLLPTDEDPDGSTWNIPPMSAPVEDGNPPDWSDDNRLIVIGHPIETAGEYVVSESVVGRDKTVADKNDSCDPDEPVVECVYKSETEHIRTADEEDIYAFPVSRLEW